MILLAKSWRAHSFFESGEHPGKISILENSEKFTFRLKPCGSGLRLMKKEWYEPGQGGAISNQTIFNFTQRKPYDQGKTLKAHSWAFSKPDVPYFCCLCGMIHDQSINKVLSVFPPIGKEKKCVWRIDKHIFNAIE